ncbi:MAG TPA: M28 family peptidase [Thermoanaerobaculia bacterium]
MTFPFAALTLSTLLAGPAASASPGLVSAAEQRAADVITPALLNAHIRFLSSDLLEGRGSASRGEKIAMEYAAAQFAAMGLEPAAPGGGWIQKVPLVGVTASVPPSMTFEGPAGRTLALELRKDFVAFSGVPEPAARITGAEVVFVGYGIVAPEFRWDDYKNVDVRGRVVLMMNNDPEDDPKLFAGKTRLRYGRWDYKYETAAMKGAVGAILIHTTPSAGYGWQVIQTSWSGERFELPYEGEPRVQIKMWATEDASRRIVTLGGQDLDRLRAAAQKRDFRPVPLPVKLSLALENKVVQKEGGNVIARLPGSDPKLSAQAVLYSAHHDHLGIKDLPGASDQICNGAVDNASGVAALLAIAEAFTRLPKAPRRSILFASVTAEEQGLLGSEYLAKHLPVPAGRIAANINVDGLNIFGRTRDLTLIGPGKSSLDGLAAQLAATQGRVIKPDQFPDRGSFYRSDQYNLSKVGVPAAYFDNGTDIIGKPPGWGKEQIEKWEATHYHQPSDEWRPDWDLSGAVEDVRLDFFLGAAVANADAMPAWNAGDEFEAARKKALAETAAK